MDWRNKLVINSVLNRLLENISVDNVLENSEIQQTGAGSLPKNAVFEWTIEKSFNNGVRSKNWKKFKRTQLKSRFIIKHNFGAFTDLFQIEDNIDQMYGEFMNKQLESFSDNDLISVGIDHDELIGKELFIPPFRKMHFDVQSFFNALYEVAQSNTSFLLNGILNLDLNVTKAIRGTGKTLNKKVRPPTKRSDKIKLAKSVVEIKNYDKGCAFHAIAVAIKKHEIPKANAYDWECVRKNYNKVREICANEIANKCGYDLNHEVSIDDFKIIQRNIEYQIVLIDGNNKHNRLFVGSPEKENKIYLLFSETELNQNHYDTITNIKGYMGGSYFCEHCHKPYSDIHRHQCEFICKECKCYPPCPENNIKITCNICWLEFVGLNCYNNHLKGTNNICKYVKKCNNCFQTYYGKKHECDKKICRICHQSYKLEKHNCYLKPIDQEKLKNEDMAEKIIISYDIETSQNYKSDDSADLQADLLVSSATCSKCWSVEKKERLPNCYFCGELYKVFFGYDCVKKFGDYIYQDLAKKAAEIGSHVYLFAHNAKSFDNHFILDDLFQRNYDDVKLIMSGNKIFKATVGNVKFLDSLLMFQQPLANLPKAFGVEKFVKKGYFPHKFHTKNNINYEGEIPNKDYFGIEFMKTKQLKDFENWYFHEKIRLNNNKLKYNLKDDLISYCKNDVLILLKCVQVFRNEFINKNGLDPITRNCTLASMGLEIFRAKVLQAEQIGVTPIKGYGNRGTYSKIGNCWLDYQQSINNCEILREIPIDKYVVDGYLPQDNKVYEYNGCYYHCHECVYPEKRDQPIQASKGRNTGKTPNEVFNSTDEKSAHLRKRGFDVVQEWDCSFAKKRKLDRNLDYYIKTRYKYYKKLELYGGVDVREAFFGGRTNNIRFWCDVTDDTLSRILYYDFRSLYPFVLKEKFFPIGHPIVISENFCSIKNYFGFIKCILEAPKDLYIPVLPVKTKNKKLVFPLCGKCAETCQHENCQHTPEERQLIGTWSTVELNYALEKGYKITEIIEVYHYDKQSNEIFAEYIRLFLKLKQQADDWPSWVKTLEDKIKYIDDFFKKEGVLLDFEDIVKNPALRFIAKLFLNTLWGKLAQRPNLEQVEICYEYKDYWELATDDEKIILGEKMVNENVLLVNWKYKDTDNCRNGNTSLAIAAFVTSYARIELMKTIDEIEVIPGRILYFDTDSVIFKYKEGEPKPQTGDYLGDLADEISKDYGENAVCTKFCSLGPKVYALEIWPENATRPIVPIKVKGVTLTDKALDLIKMESMVKLAEEYVKTNGSSQECSSLKIPQMQIRPTRMHTIESKTFDKRLRAMSEKRRIDGNNTLPFGYVEDTDVDFANMMMDTIYN